MKTGNVIMAVLMGSVLSVLASIFCSVALGLMRMNYLRIKGRFAFGSTEQNSLGDFFSALWQNLRPLSVGGILRLTFYDPRGGLVLLLGLFPATFIACATIAILGQLLIETLRAVGKI
jgi:hypothetical protein